MCGICGIYGKNDESAVKAMAKLLNHRGPDQEGYFFDNKISLGHKRLSIIDLKTGKQPLHNEDKTVWAIVNGEVYNFLALRAMLEEKGHKFYTNSDSEVILHAYEELGDNFISQLNGMFAFCIYDSKKNRIYLGRDRLGQKPIYYYHNNNYLVFASEIKALFESDDVPKEIDYNSINIYLSYRYIPHPYTAFEGIKKLPPASYLTFDGKNINIKRYWNLNFNTIKKSTSHFTKELKNLITDSVKLRLISDVPLGAFVSGGLDSSIITATMSRISKYPIKTFTIGFENLEFDETKYAKIVADQYNTEHKELSVSVDCVNILPKIIWYFDEPYSDVTAIPLYYLNQQARKHVTVILTGDGGDELFAGYRRYWSYFIDKYYYKLPKPAKSMFFSIIKKMKHKTKRYNTIEYIRKYLDSTNLPENQRHIERLTYFDDELKEKLLTNDFKSKIENLSTVKVFSQHIKESASFDLLSKMQYIDIKTFLCDDILIKADKMSMASSVELRSPLLDYRIAEFATTLPAKLKLKPNSVKYLLREVGKEILPKKIYRRKKQGMSMPLNDWFKKELKDIILDTFSSLEKRGIMDKYKLKKMFDAHMSKRVDMTYQIWSLINLEVFMRMYHDREEIFKKPPKAQEVFSKI
jgi:asparagine synthase (glutamine-hydrolysing)